ncbi:MAG: APC family permease [Euryarchaeota archaeon]|nr:APC family permease [Euryarchaeota archaeon]
MRGDRKLGFWSVFAIGVGGMVGGGIFAVLGLAVQLSHGSAPIAFAIAGLVALLTSYSYAKLSVAYPSRGGTVEFLNQAYGTGIFTGGLNILLYLSYIIMLSLYSYAFGSYGATFFSGNYEFWRHVLITSAILLFTGINIIGSKAVGESEEYIVAIKLAILIFFVILGFWTINAARLAPDTWVSPGSIVAGGMIIFLAYEGFELIANTAEDVDNVPRTLPRAYYAAVGFVIVLYIAIAAVAVGNLPLAQLINARDYALAEAAKPFLGDAGFVLIAIAALLSTGSAINATLYSSARISYVIAKDGELPEVFEKRVWKRPVEGLLITAVLTIIVANLFDLSSISTIGSSGFLILFGLVNFANFRLYRKTQSNRYISLVGAVLAFFAVAILFYVVAGSSLTGVGVFVAMVILSFVIEWLYRRMTGRKIKYLTRRVRRAEHVK